MGKGGGRSQAAAALGFWATNATFHPHNGKLLSDIAKVPLLSQCHALLPKIPLGSPNVNGDPRRQIPSCTAVQTQIMPCHTKTLVLSLDI